MRRSSPAAGSAQLAEVRLQFLDRPSPSGHRVLGAHQPPVPARPPCPSPDGNPLFQIDDKDEASRQMAKAWKRKTVELSESPLAMLSVIQPLLWLPIHDASAMPPIPQASSCSLRVPLRYETVQKCRHHIDVQQGVPGTANRQATGWAIPCAAKATRV